MRVIHRRPTTGQKSLSKAGLYRLPKVKTKSMQSLARRVVRMFGNTVQTRDGTVWKMTKSRDAHGFVIMQEVRR